MWTKFTGQKKSPLFNDLFFFWNSSSYVSSNMKNASGKSLKALPSQFFPEWCSVKLPEMHNKAVECLLTEKILTRLLMIVERLILWELNINGKPRRHPEFFKCNLFPVANPEKKLPKELPNTLLLLSAGTENWWTFAMEIGDIWDAMTTASTMSAHRVQNG